MIVLATSVTRRLRSWEICRSLPSASSALQPSACISIPLAWSTSARESAAARSWSAVRLASPYSAALPMTAPPKAVSSSASWPGSRERGRAPTNDSVTASGPAW